MDYYSIGSRGKVAFAAYRILLRIRDQSGALALGGFYPLERLLQFSIHAAL